MQQAGEAPTALVSNPQMSAERSIYRAKRVVGSDSRVARSPRYRKIPRDDGQFEAERVSIAIVPTCAIAPLDLPDVDDNRLLVAAPRPPMPTSLSWEIGKGWLLTLIGRFVTCRTMSPLRTTWPLI